MSRFIPYPPNSRVASASHPLPGSIPSPLPQNAPSSRAPQHPLPVQMLPNYPQSLSLPPPPCTNDQKLTIYMETLASMIQTQPQRILEAFEPQFASLHAEINSLKTSFDRAQTASSKAQDDVSKVQHDVSKISSDVSNISETLSTVVRAQQSSVAATGPLNPANASATPPRDQAKSRDHMLSTDETMDDAVQHESQAEPSLSVRTTPVHLSPPLAITSIQRPWNLGETSGRLSKVDSGMQISAALQSTPAPTRQFPALREPSSRDSSRSPLLPHVDDKVNNSSPHSSIFDHSQDPNEVQQLPSPPEIPTLSQFEEASVHSQLQPDSQSQSPLMHRQRQAETPVRPIDSGRCTLLPSSSFSGSMTSSTALFSPTSPQVSALSRGEIHKRIFDFLQRREEGMPIASLAISELPDLQYPTQPGIEEEENEGERSGRFDKEGDGGYMETSLDEEMRVEEGERVEMTHGQGNYVQSDEEDTGAMSLPPPPLAKEPQKSMEKKMPLFLPDSDPPSVKSMSPAPEMRDNDELSQQRRQRELEEDHVFRNLILSSQRQQYSPPSSSPQSSLSLSSRHESQSSPAVVKLLTDLTPRKDRKGSLVDGRYSSSPVQRGKSPVIIDVSQIMSSQSQQPYYDYKDEGGEHHYPDQQAKSLDSSYAIPPITSSDEVEVQLTTLSEIESSEESDEGEDGEEEEMDELLSSQEDNLHPESSDGIDHGTSEGFASQIDSKRMLLTESQSREEEDKRIVEDVHQRESGVEPELETQPDLEGMLIPQRREEIEGGGGEVDETVGDVRQEEVAESGSGSQAHVARMLFPESQMQEEGTIRDVRQGTGLESEPGTQLDLNGMLIPQSQIGGDVGDETMGNVRQEAGLGSEPGTQVDLAKTSIPQSQIGGEDKGREEVGVTRRKTSRDLVHSTMDALSTTVDSSIEAFTPRMEVKDPIDIFQRMEEEEDDPFQKMEEEEEEEQGQGQGQGQEERDRQMQVDDDGSRPQFENHHHETDHLSADLSCQNGLEKSSPVQPHDSVQSFGPHLSPRNDEVEPPSPPYDAQPESSIEPSPPPSIQVPNNYLPRESGTSGVMPPSSSDLIAPTSSMQVRNRTQQQQAEPVIPVALPEYISPVNSPSPSKSPLPVLVRGRKRKLTEMMMQSLDSALRSSGGESSGKRKEQVKQVQLVTPTRNGREKKRMLAVGTGTGEASASSSPDGAQNVSNVGIGGGKRMWQRSNAAMLVTPKRKRVVLMTGLKEKDRVVKAGEGQSEENPICLFSTPSTPTEEVGDEQLSKGKGKRKGKEREREREKEKEDPFDCIDLTGSPGLMRTRTQAAKEVEAQGGRKEKGKEKEKDKDKLQDKKEDEKRKKKEKEKKMMPVGTEDSDDAEVIPARAFKAPKVVTEFTSDDEHTNRQRNGKNPNGTTNVPILNLNGIRDRQNKAMTKVKRKTRHGGSGAVDHAPADAQKKAVDRDEEPPLKRARGRSDDRNTSNAAAVASGSKEKAPRKEPMGTSTTKTKWPKKGGAKQSDRNFVRCDKCDMWYHYGCVGVSMGDDRLKDDTNFICPPCSATGARSQGTGEGQKNKRPSASRKNSASQFCARPDCSLKDSSDDCEFWVNRIVGRKVKVEGGRGRVEVYLVEWEGYGLHEATWQEEETMGNPAELIADFVHASRKEGIDLDPDPNRTVLLKDAQAAGWTTDD